MGYARRCLGYIEPRTAWKYVTAVEGFSAANVRSWAQAERPLVGGKRTLPRRMARC